MNSTLEALKSEIKVRILFQMFSFLNCVFAFSIELNQAWEVAFVAQHQRKPERADMLAVPGLSKLLYCVLFGCDFVPFGGARVANGNFVAQFFQTAQLSRRGEISRLQRRQADETVVRCDGVDA
jgi:hypothetical protein